MPVRCIPMLTNVKRPDRQFTMFTNCSGYHNVLRMCKRVEVLLHFLLLWHILLYL